MARIEIIAIGRDKIYSVGAIIVTKKGDIYIADKFTGSDLHLSRHSDGKTHWKSRREDILIPIREGSPIKDFKGIEFLETHAFGLDSLPELYKEYRMRKCEGVFAVDMRGYEGSAFNMSIAILTEEGLPKLYESWKDFKKRQIYIYTEGHPMIAITVGAFYSAALTM